MKNSQKQLAKAEYLICLYAPHILPPTPPELVERQDSLAVAQGPAEAPDTYVLGWRGAGWKITIAEW